MLLYSNFIGLDIGKFNFVVAIHGTKETKEYDNNSNGIADFIKDYKKELSSGIMRFRNYWWIRNGDITNSFYSNYCCA
ncbi:hypothetical protein [Candidatus Tisiphia endosymbiont of Hybos culiciformis]|uniref:hypothetical protein n=1 Tax=Candidatus Tisiphia endosymbiont of Hybos culiciformis TaxID=3139331 RepID=UPI003CCACE4C